MDGTCPVVVMGQASTDNKRVRITVVDEDE